VGRQPLSSGGIVKVGFALIIISFAPLALFGVQIAAQDCENPHISWGWSGGDTPLHFAVSSSYKEVAEQLGTKKVKINAKNIFGVTPLQLAAGHGSREIVELLLSKDADVNSRDSEGRTPLIAAAAGIIDDISYRNNSNCSKAVIEMLLAKRADINAKDNQGDTTLYFSIGKGSNEIVELLLAKGASVEVKTIDGDTPLHHAVDIAPLDVMELLLAKGANINARNNRGETPLHDAVDHNRKEIVELLLAKGADVSIADSNGVTPLLLAARHITGSESGAWNSSMQMEIAQMIARRTDQAALITLAANRSNPVLRSIAASGLRNQGLLEVMAMEDKDSSVRIEATRNLANQDLLLKIAATDSDENVRYAAAGSIQDLQVLQKIAEADVYAHKHSRMQDIVTLRNLIKLSNVHTPSQIVLLVTPFKKVYECFGPGCSSVSPDDRYPYATGEKVAISIMDSNRAIIASGSRISELPDVMNGDFVSAHVDLVDLLGTILAHEGHEPAQIQQILDQVALQVQDKNPKIAEEAVAWSVHSQEMQKKNVTK
jgi:ankyrin repeat protein